MSQTLPDRACDCHVHFFGPAVGYPFASERAYTPGDASEPELNALHARLGVARVVLVQPSVYGTDNSRLVDGLAKLGDRARAIAVVSPNTDQAALRRLHAAGVRGVRVNAATHGPDDPETVWREISAQAALVAGLGWHVQTLIRPATLIAIVDRVQSLPCPLVVDHFGLPALDAGPAAPAFDALAKLVEAGRTYVKLSAMERLAGAGRLERLRPFVDRLLAANPQRLVWGTDWPHTGGGRTFGQKVDAIEPFQVMDDADALAFLADAVGKAATLRTILVDTPAKLYAFENA
jgi:predicted TIM-barrel fold metal-dependent hydrolase